MVWDSEKACEVKSQGYTRKFLTFLLLKPSRCLVRSQVGAWRNNTGEGLVGRR
jgi:hypothetical protein